MKVICPKYKKCRVSMCGQKIPHDKIMYCDLEGKFFACCPKCVPVEEVE